MLESFKVIGCFILTILFILSLFAITLISVIMVVTMFSEDRSQDKRILNGIVFFGVLMVVCLIVKDLLCA